MKQTLSQVSHGIIALFVLSILVCSCGNEPKPKQGETKTETKAEPYKKLSPDFNADSAFYFLKKQVEFGPRVTNSEVHKKCGDWMVAEFRKYCDNVIEQKAQLIKHDNTKLNARNIIAEINPGASKRILICAHWDSRDIADKDPVAANHGKPILGADDGASGVAVMLEMARVIKSNKLNIGVDFVCFDAEDLGNSEEKNSYCLGSQYWSNNPHRPAYKAEYGILFDMVGGVNAKFVWESVSVEYATPILRKVWDTGVRLGYTDYFYYYQKGGIEDDHYYVNKDRKIPTIDIIHFSETSSGFPAYHHTQGDNMSIISTQTLKAVGQTVLEVLYSENR